jgi:hypothetical protein
MNLTNDVIAYLNELAAEVVSSGGVLEGQTLEDAVIAAHSRRRSFASEMLEGSSDRAKKARRILGVQTYGKLLVRNEVEKMEREDEDTARGLFI